jgi:hypothetical protein
VVSSMTVPVAPFSIERPATLNQDRGLSHTDRHVTGTKRVARLDPQMGLRPPTRLRYHSSDE